MANVTTHHNSGFHFGSFVQSLVAQFKESRARRAAYLHTYRELAGLTDRELADIGISRGEIVDIAKEHADLT